MKALVSKIEKSDVLSSLGFSKLNSNDMMQIRGGDSSASNTDSVNGRIPA